MKLPDRDPAVNQLTVENFAYVNSTVPSIHSFLALSTKHKQQPVVQVRRDYKKDIYEKLRECLTYYKGGSTPKLRGR